MGVNPIHHKKIIKKRLTRFIRFQSDLYAGRVKPSWRRPRGIDNRVRRRFRGNRPMAKIGYGSDKKTKHVLPSGFKKFLVRNPAELEILMMNNRVYAAEVAANISARKKKDIITRAAELNVRVINAKGKLRVAENKAE